MSLLCILQCTCFSACCDFLSLPYSLVHSRIMWFLPHRPWLWFFPHSFFNNVGWMEWISGLVLSCLVCLSMLSFLLLMWMSLEWEMWDGWVCDFLCAGCLFVWKKRFKIYPVLYYHISPYFCIHNLLMLFMKLCILIWILISEWCAGVWWIGHFLCTHVFLPPPDLSTGQ